MKQLFYNGTEIRTKIITRLARIFFIGFFIFNAGFFQEIFADNCTVNAGLDQSICASASLTLSGTINGMIPGSTTWTQVSGPSVIITSPNSLITTVTGYTGSGSGTIYKFWLNATCEDGALVHDECIVTVKPITIANAGSPQTLCPGSPAGNLNGTPLGANESGAWTVVGTNNGVTIVSNGSNTSAINLVGTSSGNNTLRWTITNTDGCTSSSDVIITNLGGATVNAGPDINIATCYTNTSTATMAASLGGISPQGGIWTVVSGPNMPTITTPSLRTTTVTNLIQGTYTLRWTVSGPCMNGFDEMNIIVPPATQGLTSLGGASTQTYCDSRTEVILSAAAPTLPGETVLWTQTSGPVGATITNPTSPNTSVTGLVPTAGNSYVFKYTISNTYGCTGSVNRTVTFVAPVTALASQNYVLNCGINTASVAFTFTGGNQTQWRILSGPSGTTYNFPTAYTTSGSPISITGLTSSGVYTVELKREVASSNNVCPPITKQITITVSNAASGSTSGTPQILACNVVSTGLAGNIPTSGIGNWTQVSGPNTATIANKTLYNTGISSLIPGQYIFRWLISNGPFCATTQDDVSVAVSNAVPTSATAGPDQTVCYSTPITMTGNSPAANETGTWTVVPSAGVTISNTHDPHAEITFPNASTTYTVTWTITNACGTKSDIALITTTSSQGPIDALAGPDQCLAAGVTTATLAGNNPSPGTGVWTKLTGGSATITNTALYNTGLTGLSNGTYTFEWAITRGAGCVVSRDTMKLTISGGVTIANAGSDQPICGTTATMAGNVAAIGTGTWTEVIGPGGYTIVSPNSNTTVINGLTDGVYTFRWTISNGNAACTPSFDDVILYVSTILPTPATVGTTQSICGGATGTATLSGNLPTIGTGIWSLVSGPIVPVITTPSLYNTTVTGMTQGTYVFRWTITAGAYCPSSSADLTVNYAPAANAGSAANYCNVTEIALTGNAGSTGTWSYVSGGTTTPAFTTTGDNTAVASNLLSGAYIFKYTIPIVGTCPSTNANVTMNVSQLSVTANAGLNRQKCKTKASDTLQLHGNAPGTGNTGTWAKVSGGSGGTAFSPNANTAEAYVTISNIGDYYYSWTIKPTSCASCCSSQDVVRITVDTAYSANAGSPQTICGNSVTLAATAVNNPSYGTWTQDSGPNTGTFSSTILPNSTVSGLITGVYVFRWTVTNTPCANSYATVTITVYTPPTTPNAGNDQTVCNASSVTMAANTITTGTGSWTQVGSTPTATIVTPTSPTTTINLTGGAGIYTFQWNSVNGTCSLYDQVVVTNYAAPTPSNAGTNQSLCQYVPIYLNGNTPSSGTGLWSFVSGTVTPTIMDPSSATSQVIGTVVGTYTFRWTISNGTCTPSFSDVTITVNELPTSAAAGADQVKVCKTITTGTLAGNNPTVGTGTWTQVSGPNTAVIANIHLYNTGISGLIIGTYVFKWEIANGPCTSSDEMQFIINPPNPNLGITKTDGSPSYGAGTNTVYTIVVSNSGPDIAVGALVTDNAPTGTTITGWTAVLAGGATGATSGSGNISQTVTVPVGGSITYTVTLSINCAFTGPLVNTATVAANICDIELITNNNSATDTDQENIWKTGNPTTDWNTASNWSLGLVPGCTPPVNAIIPTGAIPYPVINTTGNTAANLIIQNGATLTINPGKDLTVCGCTEINGPCGLNLKSDETNGNASFVTSQTGTISYPNGGTACVDLWLRECVGYSGCWHYISSPITDARANVFDGDYMKYFDEATGLWSDYMTHSGSPLNVLQGYIVSNPVAGIRTFRGQLNDGTVQQTIYRHLSSAKKGWNLVGNPYVSEIDLNTTLDWTSVDKIVYYYDMVAGNYLAYIGGPYGFGLGTRYVPSMQGFFVHVYDGGPPNYNNTSGIIKFTDANRTTIGTVNFYKDEPDDQLWLKAEGTAGLNDQVIVYFRPDLTNGYDQDFDAIKLPGAEGAPQLYAVASDNTNLTIDGLAFEGINTVVPLEFYVTNGSGTYSITASKLESFRYGTNITLEDKKIRKTQELTANPTYTFSYSDGDARERFLLHFYNPFYGIDDQVKEQQDLQIYSSGNDVYVKDLTGNPEKGDFYLYNQMGQEITHKLVAGITLNKYTFDLPAGYYIVKVITKDKTCNGKVYIN